MSAGETPGGFRPDQTLDEFLLSAGELLDSLQIPYMVTGSFASSVHGEPRMTLDADLVIDPPNRGALARLVGALQRQDFYVSPEAAAEAFKNRRMFNAISNVTQYKLDLILTKDNPFDRERFARRTRTPFSTGSLWVTSPEDIVLGKLLWGRQMGGSERQERDVAGVLIEQGAALDDAYLDRWADELGVRADLDRVRAVAAPLTPEDAPGEAGEAGDSSPRA
ncbi:hypothetical protein [Alienimonas sp. DA493]|uniref:hypothetical protein n=1 Tax=Alienimonas sp. DA493 TaxID=3373605 RepID=UPI00375464F5